ncbi:MAG: RluA family pseudouridine synthase [Clostridia bacterium]|nr:RluA family pseudouridine synthase [Clostridia bacterium]
MIEFIAEKNGKLSKLALYQVEDLSFSTFQKLLRNKDVKVNGKRTGQDIILSQGDKVILYYNKTNDKYSFLYCDDNILVVDKKSGYTSESVFEQIKQKYSNAKFIHRLDRNTSGVMVFALNKESENLLLDGFKNRTFDKKYLATVYGIVKKQQDVLTAYLLKDSENSLVKIFDKKVEGSVLIKTGYKVVKQYKETADLLVELFTGKTHQIRAHLAHIGHFIIGDGKYGDNQVNKKFGVKSQKLNSYSLTLHFNSECLLSYLSEKTFVSKQGN